MRTSEGRFARSGLDGRGIFLRRLWPGITEFTPYGLHSQTSPRLFNLIGAFAFCEMIAFLQRDGEEYKTPLPHIPGKPQLAGRSLVNMPTCLIRSTKGDHGPWGPIVSAIIP